MIWKTHIRITKRVIEELGWNLSENEWSRLTEGVVLPDKLKDYPHHYNVSDRIKKHVRYARKSFLENNLSEAFFQLGTGLHYLQDSYTSYPSFLPKHQEWEEWIDNSKLVFDVKEVIRDKIEDKNLRRRYLDISTQLSRDAVGPVETFEILKLNDVKKDKESIAHWIVDLNLAYQASYAISKSVLGVKTDLALERVINVLRVGYDNKLLTGESKTSESILLMVTNLEGLRLRLSGCDGFFAPIKRYFIGRRIDKTELHLYRSWEEYRKRSHLIDVANEFNGKKNEILRKNLSWYLTEVQLAKLNSIEIKLLSIDEACEKTGLEASDIRNRLFKSGLRSFTIADYEIMRKGDLELIGIVK